MKKEVNDDLTLKFAGGICCNNGQVWDSRIIGNLSTNPGGNQLLGQAGGAALSGNGLLAHCIISNNTAHGPGGGVWMWGGILSNCTVTGNRTLGHNNNYGGGAFCLHYSADVYPRVYGCDFYANSAHYMAGGIMAGDHPFVMQDCTVISNTAGNVGAGIGVSGTTAGRNISLNRCVISYNSCASSGAGIYTLHNNRQLEILDTIISHNTSTNTGNGAGVYIAGGGGSTVMRDCLIEGNVITNGASAYGGGVSGGNSTPVLEMRNCAIIGNAAWGSAATSGRGGGINLPVNSTSVFSSCTVAGNYARYGGGGVWLQSTGADCFTNCVVAGNTITNAGSEHEDLFLGDAARKDRFFYSCSPLLDNAAQGNITAAPAFADEASGNYRLTANSAGVNAGLNESWMLAPDAVDLDGFPRIDRINGRADMGCYEYLFHGSFFFVR